MGDIAARIRSILILAARTQNKHEAAVARARAEELMERHRVHVAIDDDLVETVDAVVSPPRARLARAVALSRGCKSGVFQGGVVVVGEAAPRASAVAVYRALVARAERLAEQQTLPITASLRSGEESIFESIIGDPTAGFAMLGASYREERALKELKDDSQRRHAWRETLWEAFAEGVERRLAPPAAAPRPVAAVRQTSYEAIDKRAPVDVGRYRSVCVAAMRAGEAEARLVAIPHWPPPDFSRGVLPAEAASTYERHRAVQLRCRGLFATIGLVGERIAREAVERATELAREAAARAALARFFAALGDVAERTARAVEYAHVPRWQLLEID